MLDITTNTCGSLPHGCISRPGWIQPSKWAAILRKWAGSAKIAEKMAQEGEYDSCPAEGLNFNMTHISEYQLLGFFILVLGLGIGLGIGLIVVVGWILYHKFGAPVPSAVPSASARQVWSSSINDGSPNSHDQSLTEGTAP